MPKRQKVDEGLSKKLTGIYTGLYDIVEIGPNQIYKLRNFETNKPFVSLIHADQLKLYHDYPVVPVQDQANRTEPRPPSANHPGEMYNQHIDQADKTSEPASKSMEKVPLIKNLTRIEADTSNRKENVSNPEEYFEIEKLLRTKRQNGKQLFLVKWKDVSTNTLEPEENISKPALRQFYTTHTKKGKRRKRKQFRFFDHPLVELQQ